MIRSGTLYAKQYACASGVQLGFSRSSLPIFKTGLLLGPHVYLAQRLSLVLVLQPVSLLMFTKPQFDVTKTICGSVSAGTRMNSATWIVVHSFCPSICPLRDNIVVTLDSVTLLKIATGANGYDIILRAMRVYIKCIFGYTLFDIVFTLPVFARIRTKFESAGLPLGRQKG